jgi:hypothetical protein
MFCIYALRFAVDPSGAVRQAEDTCDVFDAGAHARTTNADAREARSFIGMVIG